LRQRPSLVILLSFCDHVRVETPSAKLDSRGVIAK
jgi:hypothetical protein